ncbi:cortexillin-1-like isoform X2 [Xenia sp. Carnegie-2017]|uniref:cortexillin-1-like isoform X2 n=1 Tax=Xenia sp. Carnegie-2017 TaxID=2897299 RepID=UPI001F0385FC|nr:cortexillin-1-like isoform X2 [Xenia sp. Carnegie-2017]
MPGINQDTEIRIYTKWINSKLEKTHPPIQHLIKDLQDGLVLISLLEVLLNTKINTKEPTHEIHKLKNVSKVLRLLKEKGFELSLESEEIVKGNDTQILALIWWIILHFQIERVMHDKQRTSLKAEGPSFRIKQVLTPAKELLLKWTQDVLRGMFTVNDLEKGWHDGFAFVFLLFVFSPSSIDISRALRMSVQERLKYAFDVAEEKFDVPSLLDPSDVEEGNVDKERMLIYFSSLYEVLRNHEAKNPYSVMPQNEHESITLRIGDNELKIQITSKNKTAMLYIKLHYTVLYSMKEVEKRMKKITEKEPGHDRAGELKEIQMEMLELMKIIGELNEKNREMSMSLSINHEEFFQVLKELTQLSKRWSALIKYKNEEISKQPVILGSGGITNSARLTIGDEVVEITSVSSNEIVLKYMIVYHEVINIIQMIEDKMKNIEQEEPSLKTSAILHEIVQMMDQVQEFKITELNDLMNEMKIAENVDSDELDELRKQFEDFESDLSRIYDVLMNQTIISNETPSTEIDGSILKTTTELTNEIVLKYKTAYPSILSGVERLEKKIEKIQEENASQENAKELKIIRIEMQELQKILCQMRKEISRSAKVDPKEFLEIQKELEELIERWLILMKYGNKEIMRQPAIVRELKTRKTTHSAHLTIGDKVIEIDSVSSNGIVIKYKILHHEIITIIKMIESNIKIIKKEEPSQKTAALLDENIQRLHQLQKDISELNQLISEIKVAENVDLKELEELQNEHKDFITHLTYVNAFIANEKARQPILITKTVYEMSRKEEITRSLHTRVKLILTFS